MAAGINDKFTEATNGTRPVPTTLTAILASGASPGTATCGALTGWPTATAVHFIIYTIDVNGNKVSGSQTDWKGIVSGSTLTGLVLKAGTNNGYGIGAVVVASPTAAWADDVTEGIAVQHNQDGTHAAVTATSVVSSGAVTGTTLTGTSLVNTGDSQLRSVSLETIHGQMIFDHVGVGCVWSGDSYGATLNASMTAGSVYLAGRRWPLSSVTARAFTASRDTYVDVSSAGALVYTEVVNNAASPALAAGSIRIGIVVTGAGNIAAAASINQGQYDRILPIASSIPYVCTDSIGNLICSRDPVRKVLGYRQCIANVTTTGGPTDVTGLNFNADIPTGRNVKVSGYIGNGSSSVANNGGSMQLNDVTAAAQVASAHSVNNASGDTFSMNPFRLYTPSASGIRNFKGQITRGTNASTFNTNGAATNPNYVLLELA